MLLLPAPLLLHPSGWNHGTCMLDSLRGCSPLAPCPTTVSCGDLSSCGRACSWGCVSGQMIGLTGCSPECPVTGLQFPTPNGSWVLARDLGFLVASPAPRCLLFQQSWRFLESTSCSPAFSCAICSVQHPIYINLDRIIPPIPHFHSLPPCYLGRQQVCHFAFLFFLLISLPFAVRASFARSLLEQHASWDRHLIRLQFPLPWSSVQSARTSQIDLGLLPHRQQGHCNPRSS